MSDELKLIVALNAAMFAWTIYSIKTQSVSEWDLEEIVPHFLMGASSYATLYWIFFLR